MLLRAINVWKPVAENRLVRLRCFEVLPSKRYYVQSADFFDVPPDAKQVAILDLQFLELLGQGPGDRPLFASLEEAIASHEDDFRELSEQAPADAAKRPKK